MAAINGVAVANQRHKRTGGGESEGGGIMKMSRKAKSGEHGERRGISALAKSGRSAAKINRRREKRHQRQRLGSVAKMKTKASK